MLLCGGGVLGGSWCWKTIGVKSKLCSERNGALGPAAHSEVSTRLLSFTHYTNHQQKHAHGARLHQTFQTNWNCIEQSYQWYHDRVCSTPQISAPLRRLCEFYHCYTKSSMVVVEIGGSWDVESAYEVSVKMMCLWI